MNQTQTLPPGGVANLSVRKVPHTEAGQWKQRSVERDAERRIWGAEERVREIAGRNQSKCRVCLLSLLLGLMRVRLTTHSLKVSFNTIRFAIFFFLQQHPLNLLLLFCCYSTIQNLLLLISLSVDLCFIWNVSRNSRDIIHYAPGGPVVPTHSVLFLLFM